MANDTAYLTIVWHTHDGFKLYAKRNGYFPNGKVAVAWGSEAHAALFTRAEARAIRDRVQLEPGDKLCFVS